MKTSCPNCGAPIEFRYDDSFVRICSNCRNAVLRTDRGIDSLGKVADLVPLESPLRLFAEGHFGGMGFLLVGMAQLRHGAGGMWQEWYAKLDGGRWGWLAEAQGRYYLTFEVEGVELPPISALSPGMPVQLPAPGGHGYRSYTVAEVSEGTYVAADGELPYKLVPQGAFHYVDMSDGQGSFATIDYGGPGDTPALYVGHQVSLADLGISGGEAGPAREHTIRSARLACPNCNAPITLAAPDAAQRVVCAHCNHLISVARTKLEILHKLASRAAPAIPLGTKGTFAEGELRVIGYVAREAMVDGTWYPFHEYLLYAPGVGFRWLVQSDGHWSYVQPVEVGAVKSDIEGCDYDGVHFRLFQTAPLRVSQVLGEFYWQVEVGETVESADYVAPPAMMSMERSHAEENWSLSTYLRPAEVQHAFGDQNLILGDPVGVAPNQPDPTGGVGSIMTLAFLALIALGIVFAALAPESLVYQHQIDVKGSVKPTTPPASSDPAVPLATPDGNPNVFFSDPFHLEGGKNVELGFRAILNNNWAYVAADLVNVATGQVTSVDADMEYYSGVEDGESWSEGKDYATDVVGPVAAGDYMVRLEGQAGGTGLVPVNVRIRQGVWRGRYLAWACLFLGLPFLGFGTYTWSFERKRWDNSSVGVSGAPRTPTTLVVAALAALLLVVVTILKVVLSSSDDD